MNHTGTGKYELLLARCKTLAPVKTAVAHPCEAGALEGALQSRLEGDAKTIYIPLTASKTVFASPSRPNDPPADWGFIAPAEPPD